MVAKKSAKAPSASKTSAPVTRSAKTVTTNVEKLPESFLDGWVREKRYQWNDHDWNHLLSSLREQGLSRLTDSAEGQKEVGRYLEACRANSMKESFARKLKPVQAQLDRWVKVRQCWNHDDWMGLLEDLRRQGHGSCVDCQETQMAIGWYLEEARRQQGR